MASKKTGNKVGAPRRVSPCESDLIKLGEEMVAWCQQHKPLHIKFWYSIEKGILFSEWDTITQKPEFLPYFEKAMAIVSGNYIDGTINPSIAQRFMRVYFKDVKREENELIEFEAKVKRAEVDNQTEELKAAADMAKKLLDQVSEAQSERKIASNKDNNQAKS